MIRPACLLILLSIAPTAIAADDGIGRLFHTPQKREILDQLRARNARIEPEQQLETVRVDGIVRRSSGRATVWINGAPHHDRYPVAKLGDRSVEVFVGDQRSVEVKVGETRRLAPTESAR